MSGKRYYTVVLDVKKFRRWLDVRRANDSKVTAAAVARKIGYGKSYLCQLLNQKKYSIEVSGRFVGTFLKTFGLEFNEIFDVVPTDLDENVDKYSAGTYLRRRIWHRQDESRRPHTYYAF